MTIRSWRWLAVIPVALLVVFALQARAVGGVDMIHVIPRVFGFPDRANSPAAVTTATNAAAARTATDLPAYAVVRIACTQNAYYKIGTSTVVASATDGEPIGAFQPEVVTMGNSSPSGGTAYTRISFILDTAASGTCVVTVLR